ncbi:F-box/kelch-repeat protein At5g43190-like [Neltuma alba]|uniref:F-box/kelch-repeat protein At5g43190-like n=1 Tax=Neltuma alba TaxID=207710 RepID=UPI0010A53C92|nr:F-box/kelch-repeat protein At5g43190-like [Prosopis alba]
MKNSGNHTVVAVSRSPAMSSSMDQKIWSRLPPELLEHILSFLPLKTFLNLRSTCKAFRSLIYSPSFITKHSSSSSSSQPFSSFFLLSHPQFHCQFPLYDSVLGSWRDVFLSFSDLFHISAHSVLVSSSGGLFCLSDFNSSSLLVCNLLAKSSRKIDLPTYSYRLEHLTLVSTPIGYKIFVLSSESASNSAFVYDSGALCWERFDCSDLILSDNYHQQGVFYNGGLYFTTPEPFSVVRFDFGSGKWQRPNSSLPSRLSFVRMVSDGEKMLYLVGGVGSNGISRSIKIWEMSELGNWVEMETLPELMCRKFVSRSYTTKFQGGLGIGFPGAPLCPINGAVVLSGSLSFPSYMLLSDPVSLHLPLYILSLYFGCVCARFSEIFLSFGSSFVCGPCVKI